MRGFVEDIEALAVKDHRDGVVHQTRQVAEADHEHFDGKTTE
jgi:hypothetical protein